MTCDELYIAIKKHLMSNVTYEVIGENVWRILNLLFQATLIFVITIDERTV